MRNLKSMSYVTNKQNLVLFFNIVENLKNRILKLKNEL